MASQDIISQLRDLQLAIDDFTDLNNATNTPRSENYSGQQDYHPTTALIDHHRQQHEKILIEEQQKTLLDSILPFQVPTDDDFSSLLDQLNVIQSTTTSNPIIIHEKNATTLPLFIDPTRNDMMTNSALHSTSSSDTTSRTSSSSKRNSNNKVRVCEINNGEEKHWIEDDTINNHRPPLPLSSTPSSSVSRTTSTLSIGSKISVRSYKSTFDTNSYNYHYGKQRSITTSSSINTGTTTKRSVNKYYARTYDEMMRIPDIHERIRFYERTYQLCIRSDSTMGTWVKNTIAKGIPQPMLEGYVPPPRPILMPSSSSYMSLRGGDNKSYRMSTSISGSISMFLGKVSSSSSSNQKIPTTPAVPDGIFRSFGRLLDKNHQLAHSLHWNGLQHQQQQGMVSSSSNNSIISSSFSPTPSLRHQHHRQRLNHQTNRYKSHTSHMVPLPTTRTTPMMDHHSSSTTITQLPLSHIYHQQRHIHHQTSFFPSTSLSAQGNAPTKKRSLFSSFQNSNNLHQQQQRQYLPSGTFLTTTAYSPSHRKRQEEQPKANVIQC